MTHQLEKALALPSDEFTNVPLSYMSCALGAAVNAEANAIKGPDSAVGFAVYGPYVNVSPGFYAVQVDISTTGYRNPKIYVDLWIEGTVLSKRQVKLDSQTVELRGWVHSASKLEIRTHAVRTGFSISGIRARRVDPASAADNAQGKADQEARRQRFRAAIGLDERTTDDEPSVEALLNDILTDAGFLWIDDTELPANELLLHRSGINPAAVRLIFTRARNESLQNFHVDSLMRGHPSANNEFQLQILKDGYLELPSPFSQGTIQTQTSFPIYSEKIRMSSILYEFSEPYHVIVGTGISYTGSISFVWFVEHDIIVYDAYQDMVSVWAPILPQLRSYAQLCTSHRSLATSYRSAGKTVACVAGTTSNLGHYFWNDVSGIERAVRSGFRGPFLGTTSEWLTPAKIFSEDSLLFAADELDDPAALFTATLECRFLLVRPTGNAIDADLAVKVGRAAQRSTQASGGCRSDGVPDDAFVLFYNLRSHNKIWLEQVDGAVDLIRRMREELQIKNIVLYLDGYSDCGALVDAIRARSHTRCTIVDGTSSSFAETLNWAYRCDFFVAVIGSGLVLLTWLAGKPGVCHGDQMHLEQLAWWRKVRPDCPPLLHPEPTDIANAEDRFYSDYNIRPRTISSLAIDHLRAQESRGRSKYEMPQTEKQRNAC